MDEPESDESATLTLLDQARLGDERALNELFARCMPALRRWARGRLPVYARDLLDTHDLVQEAVYNALRRLNEFEFRRPGSLQAYLRQAIVNRIRDEIRRTRRRPLGVELGEDLAATEASPLELAIGRQQFDRYEAALERLRPIERESIIARFELQQSYEEIAESIGKPSPDAARVTIARAVRRLVEEMDREG
jgi:RNA polymerase sigma-70 factor (ECF subfamily)